MTTLLSAAQMRGAAIRTPADRPAQRRCAEHPDSPRVALTRAANLVIQEAPDGGPLTFEGYASVVDRAYDMFDAFGPYSEVVSADAFTKTLASEGLDVPLVLAHDSLRRIASTVNGTLTLTADKVGLHCLATLDPADADVAYITPKIRSGLIREMSFAFRIDSGIWSPDWTQYNIDEVDINRGDVAIVGYGANPYTSASVRSLQDKILHQRALAPEDLSVFTQFLGQVSSIDTIVDELIEGLSAYLGAVNPDPEDMGEMDPMAMKMSQSLKALRAREAKLVKDMKRSGVRPALHLSDI